MKEKQSPEIKREKREREIKRDRVMRVIMFNSLILSFNLLILLIKSMEKGKDMCIRKGEVLRFGMSPLRYSPAFTPKQLGIMKISSFLNSASLYWSRVKATNRRIRNIVLTFIYSMVKLFMVKGLGQGVALPSPQGERALYQSTLTTKGIVNV